MLQGRRALKKYVIYYISAGGLVSINRKPDPVGLGSVQIVVVKVA